MQANQQDKVESDAQKLEKELEKAFQSSTLPSFCWNTIESPDMCPTMFPVRSGFGCFKTCRSEEISVQVFKDSRQQTENRLVRFERDIAGNCWETCINARTGKPFDDCEIDFMGKVWTAVSQKSLISNIYSPYAHFQAIQVDSLLNIGLPFQEQIFISNYDDRITCAAHLNKELKFGFIPSCVPKINRTCVKDFGYKQCVANFGCAQTEQACAETISDMVLGSLATIAKIAALVSVPGSSVFLQVLHLVQTIMKMGKMVWELIKSSILGVQTIVDQKKLRPKLHEIQIKRAARMIAAKKIADKQPLSYYVQHMRDHVDKNIADIEADQYWQKIKAKFVDTQDTPESIKKFKEGQETFGKKLLDMMKDGYENYKDIKEKYDNVKELEGLYHEAEEQVNTLQGKEAEKKSEVSGDDTFTQVLNYFGLELDPNAKNFKEELTSKYEKISAGLEQALSFLNIMKSSKELFTSKDSTERKKKELELFKSILGFANSFDPTGISGLIKTFTHDTCLAEEDLTDPLLYVKNEYSAKVKITRTDGQKETQKVSLQLTVSSKTSSKPLTKIVSFEGQEEYQINSPYIIFFNKDDQMKKCQAQYGQCQVIQTLGGMSEVIQRDCKSGFEVTGINNDKCTRKGVVALTQSENFWFQEYVFNAAQTDTLSLEMLVGDKPQNKYDYVIESTTPGQKLNKQFTVGKYQYDLQFTQNELLI